MESLPLPSSFYHQFWLNHDSQLGAWLQRTLNTACPESASSHGPALSITGGPRGFRAGLFNSGRGEAFPALYLEKSAQTPGARWPCLQSCGRPAGGAGWLGGADGNSGRPGRPLRFPFRCQEEPCRCCLRPSGPPGRFSVACLSYFIAATVPRLGLGSCRVSPLWRPRGMRRGSCGRRREDAGSPGAWRSEPSAASEDPPGTRRPRVLMQRRSGSRTTHHAMPDLGGRAGASDPPPHSRWGLFPSRGSRIPFVRLALKGILSSPPSPTTGIPAIDF